MVEEKQQIKKAIFVQHKDIKTMAKDIALLREQEAIGERERITNLEPTMQGQGVITLKQEIPREIPQEKPKVFPQEEKVLQEEPLQELSQKIPQIDEDTSDKQIKTEAWDAVHKMQKQASQSQTEKIQKKSLDETAHSARGTSAAISEMLGGADVFAESIGSEDQPSSLAKDAEDMEEIKKDQVSAPVPEQTMEDKTKKAAEEIEERWEQEERKRTEEQKKTTQQKQQVVEDREKEKTLLVENRKYFEKELQAIPDKKKPLELEKNQFLIKIGQVKQSIEPILIRERQIEQEKYRIEEKEKSITSSEDKKEVEKERWKIEEKRQEIEKQRWGQEEEIGKVEVQMQGIDSKLQEIVAKEKEATEKIDNITKRLEILKLQDEKFILEKDISEPSTKREDLKWKIKEISEAKRQIEEILSDDIKKEVQIDELIKIIEKEEAEAKTREERQTIEKKRWEIEKERQQIEKQRWEHEDEKKKVYLTFRKSELEYKTILDKEEYLTSKLEKIEELLQKKQTEIGEGDIKGLKSLEELKTIFSTVSASAKVSADKKDLKQDEEEKKEEEPKDEKKYLSSDLSAEDLAKVVASAKAKDLSKAKEETPIEVNGEAEQAKEGVEEKSEQAEKEVPAEVKEEVEQVEEEKELEQKKEEARRGIEQRIRQEQEQGRLSANLSSEAPVGAKAEVFATAKEDLSSVAPVRAKEEEQKPTENIKKKEDKQEEIEYTEDQKKDEKNEKGEKNVQIEGEREKQKKRELEQRTAEMSGIVGQGPEQQEEDRMLLLPKPLSHAEKILIRIGIAALFALIFAGIILFWYWYLNIRSPEPSFYPESPKQEQDIEETQFSAKDLEEIAPSAPLFPIEAVLTLEIENLECLQESFSGFVEQEFEEKKFIRVLIKDLSENKFLNIENFFEGFHIKSPENFYSKLDKNFTFFIYNTEKNKNRIGFVVKINEKQGFSDLIGEWEPTMEKDFENLFILMDKQGPALVSYFRDADCCGGKIIRYQTFSKEDLGICYSIVDDLFVFTSSWQGIEQTINSISN